jgi:CRP-like cAMP-binding protein
VRVSQANGRPRQVLYRKGQPCADVSIVRNGWAFRFAITASGRRQILSFLLPGDLFSTSAVFGDRMHFSVQALTDVAYCGFNREDLQRLIFADPKVSRTFADVCSEQEAFSDDRIIDLGTRSAEERIGRLIIELMARLDRRGQVHDNMFHFPLKQQHLADALGLTQVHVNRVLRRLRESRIMELSNGVLKIFNTSAIRKLADMR